MVRTMFILRPFRDELPTTKAKPFKKYGCVSHEEMTGEKLENPKETCPSTTLSSWPELLLRFTTLWVCTKLDGRVPYILVTTRSKHESK
jgi:hypothetical protein